MAIYVRSLLTLLFITFAMPTASVAAANSWPAVDALASEVAGTNVQIRCVTETVWDTDPLRPAGAVSYAIPEWGYAVLPPDICGPLVLLVADPNAKRIRGYERAEGRALKWFLHETMHLSGIADEGEAECRAYRLVKPMLKRLGVRPKRAETVFDGAWRSHVSTPPEYRTVC
jgi:hypothetical protein